MTQETENTSSLNARSAAAKSEGQLRTLSVVIPVYNSATILPKLVDRLLDVLETNCSEFEILLINDGSQDESWGTIRQLLRKYPNLRGINLLRNSGQHNATLAGIRMARYEVIVTMDDDLQQPPEEIPNLLARFDQGYDVVYGTPRRDAHAWPRVLAAKLLKSALRKLLGIPAATDITSFRVFRRHLRDAFSEFTDTVVSIDVLLSWGAARYASVPVEHASRPEGKSNYSVGMLVRYAMSMITGFSTVPLRISSAVGLMAALFGFAVLVFVLVRYLISGTTVPGFTFLASLISLLSGAQLMGLGILGEYVAGMHERSMRRPPYVISCELSSDPKSKSERSLQ